MGWKNNRQNKHTSNPAQRAADIADRLESERFDVHPFDYGPRYWLDRYAEILPELADGENECD